jgi:hypothetical protein
MSDNVLKFIQIQPNFEPTLENVKEAELYLKQRSQNFSDIQLILSEEIRFIDQGSNFESVGCPFCKKDLSIEWWQEEMGEAYNSKFSKLEVIVPCCIKESSLNNLDYNWAAGFARFSIELYNPLDENEEGLRKELSGILDCTLKKVIAHY